MYKSNLNPLLGNVRDKQYTSNPSSTLAPMVYWYNELILEVVLAHYACDRRLDGSLLVTLGQMGH